MTKLKTKPTINWTMSVAVISTAHHPQGWEPDVWTFFFKADDPRDGVVVYIEDLDPDKPEWLRTLATPLLAAGYGWVRFDQDAGVIEGLPTFEWA